MLAVLGLVSVTFLLLLGLEHFGRVQQVNCRPSTAVRWLNNKTSLFLYELGKLFAKLGYIFEHIYHSAKEILLSFTELLRSLLECLTVPLNFFRGS